MNHHSPHLNAARRRARKRTLARRDGQHCTYCRIPFADLRQATIDHVVPISLFRTWRVEHTVLACRPCNSVKANRLPLSMALLLGLSTVHEHPAAPVHETAAPVHEPAVPVHEPAVPVHEHPAVPVHETADGPVREHPAVPVHERLGEHVGRQVPGPLVPDWPLLARLAYACQSADRSARLAVQQSMCDLPVRTARSTSRGCTGVDGSTLDRHGSTGVELGSTPVGGGVDGTPAGGGRRADSPALTALCGPSGSTGVDGERGKQ